MGRAAHAPRAQGMKPAGDQATVTVTAWSAQLVLL